jgi:hypothetical protein
VKPKPAPKPSFVAAGRTPARTPIALLLAHAERRTGAQQVEGLEIDAEVARRVVDEERCEAADTQVCRMVVAEQA